MLLVAYIDQAKRWRIKANVVRHSRHIDTFTVPSTPVRHFRPSHACKISLGDYHRLTMQQSLQQLIHSPLSCAAGANDTLAARQRLKFHRKESRSGSHTCTSVHRTLEISRLCKSQLLPLEMGRAMLTRKECHERVCEDVASRNQQLTQIRVSSIQMMAPCLYQRSAQYILLSLNSTYDNDRLRGRPDITQVVRKQQRGLRYVPYRENDIRNHHDQLDHGAQCYAVSAGISSNAESESCDYRQSVTSCREDVRLHDAVAFGFEVQIEVIRSISGQCYC